MPWVDESECTGCGTCVEECPVDAIAMQNEVAEINMDECIRCGKCHEVCPVHAIKHDSERIPQEMEANVEKVKGYMEHFTNEGERQTCLKRNMNFFKFGKAVAERTLEELEKMQKINT
ncbi:4Fe-4S binding protein [bacterium]|nr:4Fe-4S binding protein [bacterium]